MMFDHGNGMWFGASIMWLVWIILIVMIVLLVKFLASSERSGTSDSERQNALSILKERYARGEIDDEEYEKRRKKLES